MKDKLVTFLFLLLLAGCSAQINTVDPQNSKSSEDSKKDGFFMKKYALYESSDKSVVLEDAWLEKTWFYEVKEGVVSKVPKHGSQLCFKLKQSPSLKYNITDYSNWFMKYKKSRKYVGTFDGVYELGFPDFNVPDTIRLEVGKIDKSNENNVQIKAGEVVFVAM